jgi:WD40 repeat protein
MLGHTGFVFSVVFNPHGSLLASGSCDEHVRVSECWGYTLRTQTNIGTHFDSLCGAGVVG